MLARIKEQFCSWCKHQAKLHHQTGKWNVNEGQEDSEMSYKVTRIIPSQVVRLLACFIRQERRWASPKNWKEM